MVLHSQYLMLYFTLFQKSWLEIILYILFLFYCCFVNCKYLVRLMIFIEYTVNAENLFTVFTKCLNLLLMCLTIISLLNFWVKCTVDPRPSLRRRFFLRIILMYWCHFLMSRRTIRRILLIIFFFLSSYFINVLFL